MKSYFSSAEGVNLMSESPKIKYSPGDTIGEYTLTAFCGGGGFGEVWLAETKVGGLPVALKIITNPKQSNKERDGLIKFQKCQHDNLIRIRHIGLHNGVLYYTMDRADNAGSASEYKADTLSYRIKQRKQLDAELVYSVAEKIADALGCMHKSGLIHRDVKPDNIIFINGKPVLADIGLVTTVDYNVSLAGTSGFLPYYVFDKSHEPCPESDFYALGVTLLCALTGKNNPADAKDSGDSLTIAGKSGDLQRLCAELDRSKNFDDVTIHTAEDFFKSLNGNKKKSTAVKSNAENSSSDTHHPQNKKNGCLKKIIIGIILLILFGVPVDCLQEKETQEITAAAVKEQPEVKKLLTQYKLTPEEEKVIAADSILGYFNKQVENSIELLANKNGTLRELETALQNRQRELRNHFNHIPEKLPAGSKAEDVPEIKKMLEKYHWFDAEVRAEIEKNPFNYPSAEHYISSVKNSLLNITKTGKYTRNTLSNDLENNLRAFAVIANEAGNVVRIKQNPEIKKALDKFAIPEHIAGARARMSASILKELAMKKTITNSDFNRWLSWLEEEYKEVQKLLLQEKILANKLPFMPASTEKIFSATDTLEVRFLYLEDKHWSSTNFTVTGVENEAQLERAILKSPVFRFDKSIQFHICRVHVENRAAEKFNVNYSMRKDKNSPRQNLQQKITSVPTEKIARNALFWQHVQKFPECEIKVTKLEKSSSAPVSLPYKNTQQPDKESDKFIDLSNEFLNNFSTDALKNSKNNQYLAEFYYFWSSQYTAIPQHIQREILTKAKVWQQDNFKKIPQTDAVLAEFISKEFQLLRAADDYCRRYGQAHNTEESKRAFARLVLLMEQRRIALWQLEAHIKSSAGVPAYRYNNYTRKIQ